MKIRSSLSILAIALVALTFVGCGGSSETESTEVKSEATKTELAKNIEGLHKKVMQADKNEDAKVASEELLEACKAFEAEFPRDPRCAEYMFMAAKAANGLQKYEESLSILDRITRVYPHYENLIEVYFLYAFTLDEDLNEKEKAKDAYTKVMNKFPGEPLSKQAEVLISQLYLSDEELIEQFTKGKE